MEDKPEVRGERDRGRISPEQPHEVERVHRQYPHLSRDEIRNAIWEKGPDRDARHRIL